MIFPASSELIATGRTRLHDEPTQGTLRLLELHELSGIRDAYLSKTGAGFGGSERNSWIDRHNKGTESYNNNADSNEDIVCRGMTVS